MENTIANDPQRPAFNNKRRFLFALGNYGCCFSWMLTSSYLMIFLTDVALLNAAMVGNIMLISRAWDAINDPIVGAYADRTKSKWGRYRPWVIFPAVPMLILNVLLFTTFPGWSQSARTWWSMGIYFVQVLVYTMINIPFSAMPAVLTLDTSERAKLSSWRMTGASVAGLIISATALPIVQYVGKGNDAKGYVVAASLFSILALPCFIGCFLGTREVVNYEVKQTPMKTFLKTLKGNKPMWLILAAFMILGLQNGGTSLRIYFWTYNVGNRLLFSTNSIIQNVGSFCGTMSLSFLISKFNNKGKIAILSFSVSAIAATCMYFVPIHASYGIPLYFCLTFIAGLGSGLSLGNLYGMAPDVTEFTTYHYGIHAAGFTSAFINFGNKLGSALMTGAAGWILAGIGYLPNQQQTQATLNSINFMSHIYVACVMVLGVIVMFFYDFDKNKFDEMAKAIQRGEYAPGVIPDAS